MASDDKKVGDTLRKLARKRRAGLGSGFPDPMLQPNAQRLRMTTERQRDALKLIQQASPNELVTILGVVTPMG